jgi:glycine dehydrogenase subunit 1
VPSIPLTSEEEKKVLSLLGLQHTDDLFSTVPPRVRERADFKMDLGPLDDGSGRGLTEHELRSFFGSLANKNWQGTHFLGGGVYDNIIPAFVNQLVSRGEFLTCYTPYQPEISQGTLQAIFEFQTMICRMTGMPIANASMYDGATATCEAVLMAQRLSTPDRQAVLVSSALHPDYRRAMDTFLVGHAKPSLSFPCDETGATDLGKLKQLIDSHNPCGVVVPSPNYFGIVEPLDKIRALLPKGCLLIVSMADPSALSIFESPGKLGADVVCGEAHQFGTPMLFGGPHVGFFATKKEFLRQIPGRLCGESVDNKGKRAYTLTLSTREQHIRREKATSNICTNQGLIALRTVMYLSFLGKRGLQALGEWNYSMFHYLTQKLSSQGIHSKYPRGLCYREGVFEVPNLEKRFQAAIRRGIVPGIRLADRMPGGLDGGSGLLICVHPKHTRKDLDDLVEVLAHD